MILFLKAFLLESRKGGEKRNTVHKMYRGVCLPRANIQNCACQCRHFSSSGVLVPVAKGDTVGHLLECSHGNWMSKMSHLDKAPRPTIKQND